MTILLDAQQPLAVILPGICSTTTCGPAVRTSAPRRACSRCRRFRLLRHQRPPHRHRHCHQPVAVRPGRAAHTGAGLTCPARVRDDRTTSDPVSVPANGAVPALELPREATNSPGVLRAVQVARPAGAVVADNVYWQSQQRDDVGDPRNDSAGTRSTRSPGPTRPPLNTMPQTDLDVEARGGSQCRRDDHHAVQPHRPDRLLPTGPRCSPGVRIGDLPIRLATTT